MSSILPMLASIGNVHIACALPGIEETTRQWAQAKGMTIEPAASGSSSLWRQNLERLKAVATLSNLRFCKSECTRFDWIYRRFGPDLVWLETPYLLRYALRWARRVPVIVDYWGTSEGCRRLLLHSRGKRRLSAWLQWRCARGGEMRYAPRLQAIVCVSDDDAAFFRSLATTCPVRVVPNAIPSGESESVVSSLPADSLRMIFTGDMSFRPNIDAAVYFTREIFPLIRAEVPGAHIVFSGRDPHPEVSSLTNTAGVEVTGAVPSLITEIVRSSVYVLPMRLGSGIRTKLFEVFPLGVPVVTTSVGAEGLVLEHGRNCLVADSATAFADACIRLLGSVTERSRLGQAMREDAMAAYSHGAVSRIVRSVIEETLDGSASFRREPQRAIAPTNSSKTVSAPANMMPGKSIIIITKDRPALFPKAVDSVLSSLKHSTDVEIIILDETDSPLQHQWPEGVRYVSIPVKNRGFGYARSLSLSLAKGGLIAFVDDDVVVASNWVDEIFKPFEDPEVAAVGGAVLPVIGGINTIGRVISLLGFPAGGLERYLMAKGANHPTGLISSCNCAFRLEAARQVGGFDELLRWGGEDQEFFARIAACHQMLFAANAVVYHHQRSSMHSAFSWFFRRGKADFFMKCKHRSPLSSLLCPLRANFAVKVAVAWALILLAGTQGPWAVSAVLLMMGIALSAALWVRRRRWLDLFRSHPESSETVAIFSDLNRTRAWWCLLPIKVGIDFGFETGRLFGFSRYLWNRVFHKPLMLDPHYSGLAVCAVGPVVTCASGTAEVMQQLAAGRQPNRRIIISMSKFLHRLKCCPNTVFFEKLAVVRLDDVSLPVPASFEKLLPSVQVSGDQSFTRSPQRVATR